MPSPADAMLELAGVGRTFADGTAAVRDLNLRVRRGEFVSVVGPSGCGKSTLLRLVSGLEPATTGAVHVAPCRLGYVFQDPTLLPWRTVARNVELLAELEGIPRAERRRRVERVLDLVGLTGFDRARPAALSGGMRMRASLARSLVLEPELFLLDEPFGALDELTRERLNDELVALFTGGAFTALFVTHSVAEAVFLSSRVVVLSPRPGRVVGEVTVPFPYPRPGHLRFAPEFGRLASRVSDLLRDADGGSADWTVLGVSLAVLRTRWLPPAVALAVFVGLWYLVSDVVLDADRRFLLPPPHAVVEVAFLDPVNRAAAAARAGAVGDRRAGRFPHRGRARRRDRHRDEPGPVGGAVALPVRGAAAVRPDPRPGPGDRVLVRLRADEPGDRHRPHRAVPGDQRHAVRPAVGRPQPARPARRCTGRAG